LTLQKSSAYPTLELKRKVRGGAGAVHNFIRAFVRDPDGSWRCIAPATWEGPPLVQVTLGMQFTLGRMFMGVDLAALLEQQYLRNDPRS
jgi:hypothetical protein